MDLRNIYLLGTVRTLFALFMLFAGVSGMYNLLVNGIDPGNFLAASGLLTLVKVVEIVAGIMLLLNFRPALATAMFAPLTVGFLVFNFMMGSPVAKILLCVTLVLVNIYFTYAYWNKFKYLFEK